MSWCLENPVLSLLALSNDISTQCQMNTPLFLWLKHFLTLSLLAISISATFAHWTSKWLHSHSIFSLFIHFANINWGFLCFQHWARHWGWGRNYKNAQHLVGWDQEAKSCRVFVCGSKFSQRVKWTQLESYESQSWIWLGKGLAWAGRAVWSRITWSSWKGGEEVELNFMSELEELGKCLIESKAWGRERQTSEKKLSHKVWVEETQNRTKIW